MVLKPGGNCKLQIAFYFPMELNMILQTPKEYFLPAGQTLISAILLVVI